MSTGKLVLPALTAGELMTPNPLSIRQDATVKEATAFLIDKGLSAVPVIDDSGRPVGVLSQVDIVVHDRERIAGSNDVRVEAIMTPAVFSVTPAAPAAKVVSEMLGLKVHRLFVVDQASALIIGVISPEDILRRLKAE